MLSAHDIRCILINVVARQLEEASRRYEPPPPVTDQRALIEHWARECVRAAALPDDDPRLAALGRAQLTPATFSELLDMIPDEACSGVDKTLDHLAAAYG